MAVYSCPRCELRFATEADLDDHLKLDHPDFSAEPSSEADRIRQETERRHRQEP